MKKTVLTALVVLTSFSLIGCGENDVSERGKMETVEETEDTTEDKTAEDIEYPAEITALYQSYKDVIEKNNLEIELGEIVESSSLYKFDISGGQVSYMYFQGNPSSYWVNLPKDNPNDNALKKTLITLVIAASEGIDYEQAKENMQNLVNGYSGSGTGSPIKLETYKYQLADSKMPDQYSATIEIASLKKMMDFNPDDYPERDAAYMSGSMNQGEMACIKGIVVVDIPGDIASNLEIVNPEGTFLIFYSPSDFSGEFEPGKLYSFYGTIAKPMDGYEGVLRIDHYSEN